MLAQIAQQSGWIPYLVFESPGWLMAFLALCFAVTRILGRRTGNPRLIHLSWIAVALIALLFASSYFVTTKREKLSVALKELLLAVEDKNFDDVRARVDEKATIAYTGKKSNTPAFLNAELTRDQMILLIDAVEFDDIILLGSSATLDKQSKTGSTFMRINTKASLNDFPGTNVSEWAIRWQEIDGRWVAIRLECVKTGADALFNRSDD